jgi:hypothetical protein
MSYVFAQALALQNVLKWLFPLVVITSFGDATKSFLLVFFKKK